MAKKISLLMQGLEFKFSKIALVLFLVSLSACSLVKNRSNISLFDIKGEKNVSLSNQLRSATIYQNFKLVVEVDMVLINQAYIDAFNESLKKIATNDVLEELNFIKKLDKDSISFVAVMYQPASPFISNRDLGKKWFYSLDMDGSPIKPASIKKLTKKDVEYDFLRNKVQLVDEWSQVFLISFDKNPTEVDDKGITIFLKGFAGQTFLTWENARELLN